MRHSILHTTDLYHPHGDPDDHFDLALQFALHNLGRTRLERILLDHPARNPTGSYSPGIVAVAQLNAIAGANVPYAIGCRLGTRDRWDGLRSLPARQRSGVDAILNTLREADVPVRIVIVGDCSDVAAAFRSDPGVFQRNCECVYVNAGTGHITGGREREWNVVLNPAAYSALFDLPCRVMWCPCFHELEPEPAYFGPGNEGENGSLFQARQDLLFSGMPRPLQNYFAYMFEQSQDPMWLDYLEREEPSRALEKEQNETRRFYSTASILHAAGLVADATTAKHPSFSFEPIRVSCDDRGLTEWTYAGPETGRYILKISEHKSYAAAMTLAMRHLLAKLTDPQEARPLAEPPMRYHLV